jgi:hypothetical protein
VRLRDTPLILPRTFRFLDRLSCFPLRPDEQKVPLSWRKLLACGRSEALPLEHFPFVEGIRIPVSVVRWTFACWLCPQVIARGLLFGIAWSVWHLLGHEAGLLFWLPLFRPLLFESCILCPSGETV